MSKLNLIIEDINKYKADAAIITNEYNRYWFTNFYSSAGYVIITNDKQYLLIDYRYFNAAKSSVKNLEVLPFTKGEDLKNLLMSLNVKNLLVEKEYSTLEELEKYWKMGFNTIGVESRKWRIVKDEKAIQALSKAAEIAANTIEWVKKQPIIGKTEKEVAKMISINMLELGATGNSFDLIVATGKNGAIPHHSPDDTILEEGNLVTIDIGCIYEHYTSDITRTFALGNKLNNPELEKLYYTVLEANEKGIQAVKANAYGNEVDLICRDYINSFDQYKNYFTHSTGHGVGLEVHELPYVSPNIKNKLDLNSVCTIEPGIYIPNLGGARIEDTVLVGSDNAIVLTKNAGKDLYIKK